MKITISLDTDDQEIEVTRAVEAYSIGRRDEVVDQLITRATNAVRRAANVPIPQDES